MTQRLVYDYNTFHVNYSTSRIIRVCRIESQNTSITVPLVMTPIEVYIGPLGFFLTPIISRLNVHFNSGCVMWALVKRNPIGLIKRSYFGGLRVKPGPTNVTLVTSRFHCLAVIHQPGEHNKELAFAKTPAQDCESRTVRTTV